MTKVRLIKFITSILLLLLVTACAAVNDNEVDPVDEPQTDPIEQNTPSDQLGDIYEPTRNEMNENFGEEIKTNVEEDIPENCLEKDEDTESSSSGN